MSNIVNLGFEVNIDKNLGVSYKRILLGFFCIWVFSFDTAFFLKHKLNLKEYKAKRKLDCYWGSKKKITTELKEYKKIFWYSEQSKVT